MFRFMLRLIAVFILLGPGYSHAVERPIIVTATRTAEIADESLAPVIVIDRATIVQSRAADIAELLRTRAGLDIGRNGGPGQASSLFLRGTDSNHTLVMIDGVKINPGTIGGAPLHNINPDLIERIEIVKGPRSTLYGSDAIGGVINIITRRADRGVGKNVYLGSGRHETKKAGVALHQGSDHSNFGIDLGYSDTAGYSPLVDSDIKRGHDNLSINLFGGTRLGAAEIEASLWQAAGTTEYLDFFASPLSQDYVNRTISLRLSGSLSDYWYTILHLSQMRDKIDQNESSDFAHTQRNTLDWQNNIQLKDDQLLTAGIYLAGEDASSLIYGSGFDHDIETRAVYAQHDLTIGDHRFLLAARYSDHESFGGHTTWNAEYGYHLNGDTRITAAAATAYRAPDATDRFGFGGDPDLKPETSRNIELGFHHRLSESRTFAANIFDNRIEDLIEYDIATDTIQNIGSAHIQGIEASYQINTKPWGGRMEAIIQKPWDESNDELLARRAQRSLTAMAYYDTRKYRVAMDWLLTSRRKDSAFSNTYNSGYGLLNLTAQTSLNSNWILQGRVDNVTDIKYTLADGYNTDGRALYLEIRYESRD